MKVRAIAKGFSKVSREPGDVFEIKDERFSARWMEKLDSVKENAPVAPPPPPPLEGEVLPPPPIGPTADGTAPKPKTKAKPGPKPKAKPDVDIQ